MINLVLISGSGIQNMKEKASGFASEATPVIDLRTHSLVENVDISANDPSQNWDNEKTEVYRESEEAEELAALIDSEGVRYSLTAFPFVIGRGGECDMVLVGKGLSRKHIEIVVQSGRFVVNDLDSLNGLKVNGYKVSRVILEEGDILKLGEVLLTFDNGTGGDFGDHDSDESAENTYAYEDGPFKSDSKKLPLLVAGIVGVIALGVGGYLVLNAGDIDSSVPVVADGSANGRVNNTSNSSSKAGASLANKNPSVTSANSKNEPPSSISLAAPASISGSAFGLPSKPTVKTPTKPKILKTALTNVKKPKPIVKASKNEKRAARLLANADSRYLDGEVTSLFKEFKLLKNDSSLSSGFRSKLKKKQQSIATLYSDYSKGQKAFAEGDRDTAFNAWTRFLENEGKRFKKSRSTYANRIVTKVTDEYVARGNTFAAAGENHKAYAMWQKAVKLGDNGVAKIAMDAVKNKSKQLYRKALRLEYVNSLKAKELWKEVMELVPAGSEYYIKASAKLAWHERWGG